MNYYRVGICDDEEIFLEKIYHLVKSNLININCDFVINRFNNAKDLILSNCEEDYNIIFLDIDMPKTNGIEAAIALKQSSPNIVTIFITSKDELVFESIKTQPFRFIRKSKLSEEISEAITEAHKSLDSNSYKLTIKVDNNYYKIDIGVITYIESNKNYIIVNTFNGNQFRYKQSISFIENELESYGFIRTHSGYIVNQKYIQRIEVNDVVIRNDIKIPISRSKKHK